MMTNRTRGCLKIQFLKYPFFEIKKEGISILRHPPNFFYGLKVLSDTNILKYWTLSYKATCSKQPLTIAITVNSRGYIQIADSLVVIV